MKKEMDIKILREHKDTLFKRPLIDAKTFFDIASGKKTYNSNFDKQNIAPLDIDTIDFDPVQYMSSFGEYLNEMLIKKEVTLNDAADKLDVKLDYLIRVLDDDILPWDLDLKFVLRVKNWLNLDQSFVDVIKNQPIRMLHLKREIKNYNVAARSNKDLTDKERKKLIEKTLLEDARIELEGNRDQFVRELIAHM